MSEENKALARRSWEAVDNPVLIDEVYASDLVWHEPDQEVQAPAASIFTVLAM